MAYQVRQRDPLLDSSVQISLARRGREGFGVLMVVIGLLLGAMLASYHPDDPNWLAATDAPAQNWLGLFGASLAAPLYLILGHGAFGLAAGLVVWGLRFAAHLGSERALPRALFLPGWVLILSVYAASMVPGPGWGHDFGLGGLFGDTAMGVLVSILPITATVGLKLLSVAVAAGAVVAGAWVLGFTREDLTRGGFLFLAGLGNALHLGRVATGTAARTAARGAAQGAQLSAAALAERRARLSQKAGAAELDDDPIFEDDAAPVTAPSARARLLSWLRRAPEGAPEPAGIDAGDLEEVLPEDGDDRVRARIANAVRTRVRRATIAQALTAPVVATPSAARVEPVLSAAAARALPEADAAGTIEPTRAPSPDAGTSRAPILRRGPVDATEETDGDVLIEATPADEGDTDSGAGTPEVPVGRDVESAASERPAPAATQALRVAPSVARRQPERAPARAEVEVEPTAAYEHPPLHLLTDPATIERHHLSDEALEENARLLESVLEDYGVKGDIVSVRPGPVVTMYELEPAPGLKASRVIGLADDIARSMSALSARVSTVPGRSVIGIELPNDRREKVVLREILAADDFEDTSMSLPLALGKDIGGSPVVANLAKMPHLLIAGTTGSGKSVAINTMILSLLYKLSPEECRLIMIDPKMLELSVYDGIPHLLSPVVTDPKKAVVALKWVVGEMEERYRKMSKMGVRNIEGHNGRVEDLLARGEMITRTFQTGFDDETGDPVFETEETVPVKLPYIVVVVDEMADLMMVAGKEIEACIQRLAQMARASGIHLVMATQRPSVDVITGTVKANFPTRISFHVTSKIDSRTILGEMGAEQLLGMGDMLYMAGGSKITRVHGPFCSDEEVEEIVNHLKSFGPPEYASSVLDGPDEGAASDIDAVLGLATGGNTGGEDALYDQAVAIAANDRKCSTSYIQRKLGIGYNKAARLVEQMEENGVVSPANHVGKRDVLLPDPNG